MVHLSLIRCRFKRTWILLEAMLKAPQSEHFFPIFSNEEVMMVLSRAKKGIFWLYTLLESPTFDQNNQDKKVQPLTSGRSHYK